MFAIALLLATDIMVVPLVHKDPNESARFAENLRVEIDSRPTQSAKSLAQVIDNLVPKSSQRYEQAQEKLGLADRALEAGEIDKALEHYEAAVATLAVATDFSDDKRILLEKTRLALASRLLGLNAEDEAKKHLRDALQSNNTLTLSELEYPPKVRLLFERARSEIENDAHFAVSITSPIPGAMVFIEGRKVGLTPYTQARMAKGRYRVWLEREGARTKTRTLIIDDKDVSVNVTQTLESALRVESNTIDLKNPDSKRHNDLFELFGSDTIALVAQDEVHAFGVLIKRNAPTQKIIVSRGENAAKAWAACALEKSECQTLPFPKGFYDGLTPLSLAKKNELVNANESESSLLPIALYSGAALVTVLAIAGAASYAFFIYEPERGGFGVEVVR